MDTMDEDGCASSSGCSDEIVMRDSAIWRDGPAKHIYDQLGIPEDCDHLDYSIVLNYRKDAEEEEVLWGSKMGLSSQTGSDQGGEDDLLALAIQSILPPSNSSFDEGNQYWKKGIY